MSRLLPQRCCKPEDEIVALAQKHNNGADLTITDDISEVKGVDMPLYGCLGIYGVKKYDFKSRIDYSCLIKLMQTYLPRRKIQMSSLCTVSQLFMISSTPNWARNL